MPNEQPGYAWLRPLLIAGVLDAVEYRGCGSCARRYRIIAERGNELYLDTTPCAGKVASFTQLFRKTKVGKVQCKNQEFDQYEIRQR